MSLPSSTWAADFLKATVSDNLYLRGIDLSEKQRIFLAYPCREILFGGAGGGGKSYALLISALQFVTQPGYNAILFRRSYADLSLPDSLIPLSHTILSETNAKWNGQDYRWTFPSGATVSFGYMAIEQDKYRYKSSQFQFVGFDELTAFSESQYRYMFSRLRKSTEVQAPLRMRAATNPGDVGHQWVFERFVKPDENRPTSRVFIPSKRRDNPWLNQEAYEESLAQVDHITRAQIADGDWNAILEGHAFKSEWIRYYRKESEFYRIDASRTVAISDCIRFAAADIAGTEKKAGNSPDYTVIQIWDLSPTGDLFLADQWRGQMTIPDVEERLMRLAWEYNVQFCAVESNGIGLPVIQSARRRGLAVKAVPSRRSKFARAQTAMIRMEHGGIFFPSGSPFVDELRAEMAIFPSPNSSQHDDQVDTLSIAAAQAQRIYGPLTGKRDTEYTELVETSEIKAEEQDSRQRRESAMAMAAQARSGEIDDGSAWIGYDED